MSARRFTKHWCSRISRWRSNTNADTQLRGGLLNVFLVLNPGHHADEAQAVFQLTLDKHVGRRNESLDLAAAAKRMTIAERIYSVRLDRRHLSFSRLHLRIVGESLSEDAARLEALDRRGSLLQAMKLLYMKSPPFFVLHPQPNDQPPKGTSEKSDSTAASTISQTRSEWSDRRARWVARRHPPADDGEKHARTHVVHLTQWLTRDRAAEIQPSDILSP